QTVEMIEAATLPDLIFSLRSNGELLDLSEGWSFELAVSRTRGGDPEFVTSSNFVGAEGEGLVTSGGLPDLTKQWGLEITTLDPDIEYWATLTMTRDFDGRVDRRPFKLRIIGA